MRELRVEDGYAVAELGNSTYTLEGTEPDRAAAERWGVLNEIRQQPGSARGRVGKLFEALVGEIVTNKDIDYVARSPRVCAARGSFGTSWGGRSHLTSMTPSCAPVSTASFPLTQPTGRAEIVVDDVAAAMIDRLAHHSEILALTDESHRLKDRDLARPRAARPQTP